MIIFGQMYESEILFQNVSQTVKVCQTYDEKLIFHLQILKKYTFVGVLGWQRGAEYGNNHVVIIFAFLLLLLFLFFLVDCSNAVQHFFLFCLSQQTCTEHNDVVLM